MKIEHYLTAEGKDPIQTWLIALKDMQAKQAIIRRIDRAERDNLGIHTLCRSGVWEFKIDVGPGYRVYFAKDGSTLILLLCGGDKSSQNKDIEKAIAYFEDYKQRKLLCQ